VEVNYLSCIIVLHEATRTGAPRIGGLIAGALRKYRNVHIVCLSDGPLLQWLRERVGSENVHVHRFDRARHHISFDERVRTATSILEQYASPFVYVNSLASSEFIVAAKAVGKFVVLHVHDKVGEMKNLLAAQLMKLEVLTLCDAVVLAAEELERDIVQVFGFIPDRLINFGIAVDVDEIVSMARESELIATTATGVPFKSTNRMIVGMVGHASKRKGVDVFFEAARALPQHDFVCVGNWELSDAPENIVHELFLESQLPNLYISGNTNNPYKYISSFDLFFLSSREDPNPVVVAEALVLRVPILAFSNVTAVTNFLGRSAILCHGHTNIDDAVRVLRALDKSQARSHLFRPNVEESLRSFDIVEKIIKINDLLDSLAA
jgi:glycosyltransferase involved in cell wall biosynthesis